MENNQQTEMQMQRALKALKDVRQKLELFEQSAAEPIAIVGMGCRYPGNCNNPADFWKFLSQGGDAIKDIPSDRWDVNAYYDADPDALGKMYTRQGGFLDRIDGFDAEFFGIAPREAQSMDPQQRLFLEVSWEALEDAGIAADKLNGSNTAVYAGVCTDDYSRFQMNSCDPTVIDAYSFTGTATSITVGRLSYLLGLQGPNICVNTACSSSLVAIDLACNALRSGKTNLALAGGVNLIIRPENSIYFCKVKALSRKERCRTFDDGADGYVRGEGCGIVVLKRLSDALANNDQIYALLKGSAVNQDGRSNGMTAPNGLAQQAVIRGALANAKVLPSQIGYVEAHGTGTSLGDPIEIQALGSVLETGRNNDNPFLVGSVKTNIGHLEAAAGMAGMMKAALALKKEAVPQHLHLSKRNRHIPWDTIPVSIPSALTPWKRSDKPRYAGVSGFGFSGTNAHVILQEAPVREIRTVENDKPLHLLTISARNAGALKELVANYAQYLADANGQDIRNICYTANTGRMHFSHRLNFVGDTREGLRESIFAYQRVTAGTGIGTVRNDYHAKTAFVFTGQGAQYFSMGREFYESQPTFRRTMDRCAELLQPLLQEPLLTVLFADDGDELLNKTSYSQPALFAIEYSLAVLWQSWGVSPGAVMGHSVGEYAAACVAGVFSLEDGITLVAARGRLMQAQPECGGMAAVFADEETVRAALKGKDGQVVIAGVNAPDETVISGNKEAISGVLDNLAQRGVKSKLLNVSHAFHSPLMAAMLDEFSAIANKVTYFQPQMEYVSNVSGAIENNMMVANADYWCRHVLEPVKFLSGVNALYAQGYDTFIEVGPAPILTGLAKRGAMPENVAWMPSMRRDKNGEWGQILRSLGELYMRGIKIDWEGFDRDYSRERISLPTYAFQRRRFWVNTDSVAVKSKPAAYPKKNCHPLLGEKMALALTSETVYASTINMDFIPFLSDHRVFGKVVAPATAYLEMALAAGLDTFGSRNLELEKVEYHEGLFLAESEPVETQLVLSRDGRASAHFKIHSRPHQISDSPWRLHASGRIGMMEKKPKPAQTELLEDIKQRCSEVIDSQTYYAWLEGRGYEFGPCHQGVGVLWRGVGESLGKVKLHESLDATQYQIHPALLDSCCQVLLSMLPDIDSDSDDIYITVGKGKVRIYGQASGTVWSYARVTSVTSHSFVGELKLYDEHGKIFAEIEGYATKKTSRAVLERAFRKDSEDDIYKIEWQQHIPASEFLKEGKPLSNGRWLIMCDKNGLGEELAKYYEGNGQDCILVYADKKFERSGPRQYHINQTQDNDFNILISECFDKQNPCSGILFLWGADKADKAEDEFDPSKFLASQERGYGALLKLYQAVAGANFAAAPVWLLVTRGTQSVKGGTDDLSITHSTLWGLGRVIAKENLAISCLQADLASEGVAEEEALFLKYVLGNRQSEQQFALRDGRSYIPRLAAEVPARQRHTKNAHVSTGPYRLAYQEGADIDQLTIQPLKLERLGREQVLIQVMAAGLSLNDVMKVMGIAESQHGLLGHECSGVVLACGEEVLDFSVGDEVIAYGTGCLASQFIAEAACVVKKPANIDFNAAATLPTSFLTAYHALHILGKIREGERVLIHSAAGGVGMAAVQLAKLAGAEIYATASLSKWETLKNMGVTHVMDSRSLGFDTAILALTGGEGVDLVINSLSDGYVDYSLSCLKPSGRFIELGHRTIRDANTVAAMYPGISYYSFSLDEALDNDPHGFHKIFRWISESVQEGLLQPLLHTDFSLNTAAAAFRYMSQSRHIGKIVLSVEENHIPQEYGTVSAIYPNATYLITGGLGGLGLSVANWLAERGARTLVLVGRKASQSLEVDKLRDKGIQIHIMQADVADAVQVEKLLLNISSNLPPLRGVIHAAGVTDDAMLLQQNWQRFEKVMAPKILGAQNLHHFTRDKQLDFFILFSSITSILGADGVANYAASNAYLDALAHYRRAKGLAAVSINWGPWSGAGMLEALGERGRQHWIRQGIEPMSPDQCIKAMEQAMHMGGAQYAIMRVTWDRYFTPYLASGNIPSLLRDLDTALDSGTSKPGQVAALQEILGSVPSDERKETVIEFINELAVRTLGLDAGVAIDPTILLTDVGLDSLMSVELRNSIAGAIGETLPSTVLFDYPSMDLLATYLCNSVLAFESESDDVPSGEEDVGDAVDEELLRDLVENKLAQLEGM